MKYNRSKLSNGSSLVHIHLPYSPGITVSAYIKAGFRSDPIGKPGLAHFAEHMLFTGSKKFPSHYELATKIEKFGGWHYAYTWIDYQQHEICLPFQYASKGIEILLDTIYHSLVRKTEVEKEKEVIKREILRYTYDMDRSIIYSVWFPLFFQGTKLSNSCIGSETQIETYKDTEIKTFIKDNFLPNNMVFLVAGNISQSQAIEDFEKYIQKNKASLSPNKSTKISLKKNYRVLVKPYESEQVAISIGIQTVSMDDPARHVFELIKNMLSRDFGASIPAKLRDQGGLTYGWFSSQENLLDSGYLVFTTMTTKKNVMLVLKIILGEFERMAKGNFSQSEVEMARSNLLGSLQINLETNYSLVHWYGLQELITPNNIVHPQDQISIYRNITKNDIAVLANKYFAKDKIYIGLLGNIKQHDVEAILEE